MQIKMMIKKQVLIRSKHLTCKPPGGRGAPRGGAARSPPGSCNGDDDNTHM